MAATGLKKSVYLDTTAISSGMVIISDEKFNPPENTDKLQVLNVFLFYFRPTAKQIGEDYRKSPVKGQHPRVMSTAGDFARIRYELRGGVRLMYVSDDFDSIRDISCKTLSIPYRRSLCKYFDEYKCGVNEKVLIWEKESILPF